MWLTVIPLPVTKQVWCYMLPLPVTNLVWCLQPAHMVNCGRPAAAFPKWQYARLSSVFFCAYIPRSSDVMACVCPTWDVVIIFLCHHAHKSTVMHFLGGPQRKMVCVCIYLYFLCISPEQTLFFLPTQRPCDSSVQITVQALALALIVAFIPCPALALLVGA